MAIRYAALRNDPKKYPDITGLIAIAAPYSLPDTIRKKWQKFKSKPSYKDIYEKARPIFKPQPGEKPPDDEIIMIERAHGKTRLPEDTELYTLKTWWALAGPEAEGTKNYKNIANVKIPALLVYGLHDDIIERSEFDGLSKIARNSGNKNISKFELEADHKIQGKHAELAKGIVNWLNKEFK